MRDHPVTMAAPIFLPDLRFGGGDRLLGLADDVHLAAEGMLCRIEALGDIGEAFEPATTTDLGRRPIPPCRQLLGDGVDRLLDPRPITMLGQHPSA